MKIRTILCALVLTGFAASSLAQTVTIPDEGLDNAIRDALQKPTGPLTQQDLLTLTNLNASDRSIFSLDGLEAARNLTSLDLSSNFLANPSIPATLTKLHPGVYWAPPRIPLAAALSST
jgi:Leucine-rich repeat (LRR) protein